MSSSIWTSAQGAVSQADRLEIISNNLANSSTHGFKADDATFKEYVGRAEKPPHLVPISPSPIQDRDFFVLGDKEQSSVVVDGTYTRFGQGVLQQTGHPLDMAIDGAAFFEVLTPEGIRFTRAGNFKVDATGNLVTSQGYPVLSQRAQALDTKDPSARIINLADSIGITLTSEGELFSGLESIANLSLIEFNKPEALVKTGGLLFRAVDPAAASLSETSEVYQGYLERSNVNPVHELATLMSANRLFEQDLKTMKAFDEMMAKEANDIGKL
jgi:flagellar basal-body rod protein FlgG